MRVITTEKDYNPVSVGVEKILEKARALPEKVFKNDLKFFLFITFDELFMPLFFNNLKRYLFEVSENSFWVAAIDPDPKLYFGANFNFFGAFEFSGADTDEEYLAALSNYPETSLADALAHNTNSLIFFSSQYEWAVYGDRNADIAICAFSDLNQMERFKFIYDSDLLGGVNAAADYIYGARSNSPLKLNFCISYSEG